MTNNKKCIHNMLVISSGRTGILMVMTRKVIPSKRLFLNRQCRTAKALTMFTAIGNFLLNFPTPLTLHHHFGLSGMQVSLQRQLIDFGIKIVMNLLNLPTTGNCHKHLQRTSSSSTLQTTYASCHHLLSLLRPHSSLSWEEILLKPPSH